jgi:cobalamin synthase
MAYQTHHCSAVFRCSVCLIVFLQTSLALSVLPLFMLCAPCPFTVQFLFCALQLLHSPPSSHMNHLHQQSQQPPTATTTTPFSSLYCVFIASVHLVHAMFAMPLHADSAPLSSTSRVFCLIIIVTLQLLWWFAPRVQHHCMLS